MKSRRRFLQSVGVSSLAAGLRPAGLVEAEPARAPAPADFAPAPALQAPPRAVPVFGPGLVSMSLHVNGVARTVEVEPRTTLLDALRLELRATGAKRVCDRASCGACTVLLDDHPVYACAVLAIEAQGRSIQTVEGLAPHAPDGRVAEGALHPVQRALWDADGLMCGFCTPGVVMSTAALVARTASPTPDEVRQALAGHICRCGAYTRILEAVMAAAAGRRG